MVRPSTPFLREGPSSQPKQASQTHLPTRPSVWTFFLCVAHQPQQLLSSPAKPNGFFFCSRHGFHAPDPHLRASKLASLPRTRLCSFSCMALAHHFPRLACGFLEPRRCHRHHHPQLAYTSSYLSYTAPVTPQYVANTFPKLQSHHGS